jgi:hypothetical protein
MRYKQSTTTTMSYSHLAYCVEIVATHNCKERYANQQTEMCDTKLSSVGCIVGTYSNMFPFPNKKSSVISMPTWSSSTCSNLFSKNADRELDRMRFAEDHLVLWRFLRRRRQSGRLIDNRQMQRPGRLGYLVLFACSKILLVVKFK